MTTEACPPHPIGLSTSLTTGPPTKLSAWKLPGFPRGSATQNRLRPPNPAAVSYSLHGPGERSSDPPQPRSCPLSPRKPVLTPGLSSPSWTWSPWTSGSHDSRAWALFHAYVLRFFYACGVRLGTPGKWQVQSWELTWEDKFNSGECKQTGISLAVQGLGL